MAQRLTSAEIKGLFEKCNNWGKWGKDDQRGALNYITEKQVARASKLVQTGETASCALPLPVTPAPDNPTPVTHLMVQSGHDAHHTPLPYSGDYFAISFHGMATTHIDALCHVFWEKKMYNGFDASEVGSHGARKCPIDVTRTGIVSRGVLLDIPKLKKVDWLEKGEAIFPAGPRRRRKGSQGPRRRGRRAAGADRSRRESQGQRRMGSGARDCPASMRAASSGCMSAKSRCSAPTR